MHYKNALLAVQNVNVQRVRSMASSLDREFAIMQAKLSVLDTTSMYGKGDLSYSRDKALAALDDISVDSIVLLDEKGRVLFSTLHPQGTILPRLGNSPAFEGILANGRPAVSDLFIGTMYSTPIVAVAVPLKGAHQPGYSLNGLIIPGRISRIIAEQQFPETWRATIVDSQGGVAARSHSISKFLGKKVSLELIESLQKDGEGSIENRNLDGTQVLTVYSRAPVSGWAVTLGIPTSELKAPIRTALAWLAAAVLGAMTIGLTLSWFIGGQIAQSIQNLIKPARALGLGLPVKVMASKLREAEELGSALLEAATQLERSKFAALHDSLTGLSNRSALDLAIKHHLACCTRNQTTLAILFIDLDGFKAVNDKNGHAAGDTLLCIVAERLQCSIRNSDLAARIGGDEFAILLVQSDDFGAIEFANRLVETLSAPYIIGNESVLISASIGVACGPLGYDGDTLVKRADDAMYRAKSLGKARVSLAP